MYTIELSAILVPAGARVHSIQRAPYADHDRADADTEILSQYWLTTRNSYAA
jgi:hypothetical protein